MAEGVGGAAAVREELPRLSGHGEHVTSVSNSQLEQPLWGLFCKLKIKSLQLGLDLSICVLLPSAGCKRQHKNIQIKFIKCF